MEVHEANDEYVAVDIMNGGAWEPFETEVVRCLLNDNHDFYDVGANIGWYSVVAGLCLKGTGGAVHAFEPALDNLNLLTRNVTANGLSNVRINPCALGDRVGAVDVHLCSTSKGDHRVYECEQGREVQAGSITRFDEYYRHSSRIPFIKMDTQGFEFAIMQGMGAHLKNLSSLTMLIEFWPRGLARDANCVTRLIRMLAEADFKALTITEDDCHVRPADWATLALAAETTLAPSTNGFVNLLLYREGDPASERLGHLFSPEPSHHLPAG